MIIGDARCLLFSEHRVIIISRQSSLRSLNFRSFNEICLEKVFFTTTYSFRLIWTNYKNDLYLFLERRYAGRWQLIAGSLSSISDDTHLIKLDIFQQTSASSINPTVSRDILVEGFEESRMAMTRRTFNEKQKGSMPGKRGMLGMGGIFNSKKRKKINIKKRNEIAFRFREHIGTCKIIREFERIPKIPILVEIGVAWRQTRFTCVNLRRLISSASRKKLEKKIKRKVSPFKNVGIARRRARVRRGFFSFNPWLLLLLSRSDDRNNSTLVEREQAAINEPQRSKLSHT